MRRGILKRAICDLQGRAGRWTSKCDNIRGTSTQPILCRYLHWPWLYSVSYHSVSHTQNDDDLTGTFSCTCIEIHGYEIEPFLRWVINAAPGCGNVPSWLFNKCSVELADVVAKLLNISFASGRVYANWKMALVTHVPKVTSPASFGDSDPFLSHPWFYHALLRKSLLRDGSIQPFHSAP